MQDIVDKTIFSTCVRFVICSMIITEGKDIMRHFTVSVLSMFIILPTIAGAGLPVVNIASGGISARSAFGEDVEPIQKQRIQPTRKKTVVARSVKPVMTTAKTSVDTGERIVATNDVLNSWAIWS